MRGAESLVGREEERRRLLEAAALAASGHGSVVLLAGEAGVGKTTLSEHVAAASGMVVLKGTARQAGEVPYGPVAGALRSQLRSSPDVLGASGPLREHLALILPEL